MHNYQHLKCPGHYVNEKFLRQLKDIKPDYLSSRLFRSAVVHQHTVLRRWLKEELGTDQFSLDHHPVPFSALKRIFLKLKGIDPDQPIGKVPTVQLLKDWQRFHGALAEYRVVDRAVNLQLGQRHHAYWHNRDRQPVVVT